MKLPFVGRALYESKLEQIAIEREINTFLRRDVLNTVGQWSALLQREQAKHDDLLARYHMLRLQGAVPVSNSHIVAASVDPVIGAIAVHSGGDPELRALMETQAMLDRADGKKDVEIIAAIRAGQSSTNGTVI